MPLKDISNATLGHCHSVSISAKDAVLELDRDDLYAAACEATRLFREEILRRQEAAPDQAALDRINADLRGLSVADLLAERGEV